MRIKKLQSKLKEKNIDLALIFSIDETPNTNMVYYADFEGIGVLAVTKRNHFLVVPESEYERAKRTKLKVYKSDKKKRLLETLTKLLSRTKIRKTGIEYSKVSVYLFKKLKKAIKGRYTDISRICSEIRMIKEEGELKNITKACNVTDLVFSKIIKKFKFKFETELRDFIVKEIYNSGCELAFPPIVASNKNTSLVHSTPSGKITKGFLLLDFGAKYKGYCADMTRMLYIGKPTKKELNDFGLLLNTITLCEDSVKLKTKYSKLFTIAVEALGDKAEYFTHSLGHGLGLDIHESPNLSPNETLRINNNIPFTIEPGIYLPDKYGIRIEDTVVLINNKLKILTKSKKDLVII